MCNPIQDNKVKQAEKTIQTSIHQELTQLQSWDLENGQTLEQRRQSHREQMIHGQLAENTAMQAAAQAQMTRASADAAADGSPVQEQTPAQLTYKQRKEQQRKAKAAQKNCGPAGTADSYDCVEAIRQQEAKLENSLDKGPDANGVDGRVLRVFCSGHKTKRNGKPASAEDQALADADNAFLEAYTSKDLEARKPYLEQFRQEIVDFPLRADCASPAYMVQNIAELKQIFDRSCYYDNIMNDPINKPFFDAMDPAEYELLVEKRKLLAEYSTYCLNYAGGIGVDLNHAAYYPAARKKEIRDLGVMAEFQKESLTSRLAGWDQQKRQILEKHTEEDLKKEKQATLDSIELDKQEQTENLPEDMNFAGPSAGYATEELKRYRAMIESHPEVYTEHKDVISKLYQELYRGLDILNEMAMDTMVYQGVIDTNKESTHSAVRARAQIASDMQEKHMESLDSVRKQLDKLGQAMEFYLKGHAMTDGAMDLLKGMGFGDAAAALADQRAFEAGKKAVKEALEGEDGALANSNRAYQDGQDFNSGLTGLGVRSSTSPYAKADKLLRGNTFTPYLDQIRKFSMDLDQKEDLDTSTIMQQTVAYKGAMGGGVAGGPIDEINRTMLHSFSEYLKSDGSIRYLQTLVPMLKSADMFHNDAEPALAYVVQSLFNSYGANFAALYNDNGEVICSKDTLKVMTNSTRTLMSLAAMQRRNNPEIESNLPDATKELLSDYRQLLSDLKNMAFPSDAPEA